MKELNQNYEYRTYTELEGNAARYFTIPKSIITNTELGSYRVSVFCYFSIYRGLHGKTYFSVPMFLDWTGYKNNTHKNGINDKVIDTIDRLNDGGYLLYKGNRLLTRTSFVEISFDTKLVSDDCHSESFGIFYIDEIEKIMQYKNNNKKDTHLNSNTILLVFAYLRQAIFRMKNELKPEERHPDGIAERRARHPEAYSGNFKDIARELGLSERAVSKAVEILEELELIVSVEAYHTKDENKGYRTQATIFANMEKREDTKLLARGYDYAYREIEQKEKNNQKYFPNYKLKPHGKQKEILDHAG